MIILSLAPCSVCIRPSRSVLILEGTLHAPISCGAVPLALCDEARAQGGGALSSPIDVIRTLFFALYGPLELCKAVLVSANLCALALCKEVPVGAQLFL